MQHILLLGAGKSATGLFRYWAKKQANFYITVVDRDLENTKFWEDKINFKTLLALDVVTQKDDLIIHFRQADIVISLLPVALHKMVANLCLVHHCHLLTASYLSQEILNLEQKIKEKGLLFLFECGLDPGIDQLISLDLIGKIKERSGIITSYKSFTGGLFHPKQDTWGYRFTWNSKNVVLAGQEGAKLIQNNRPVLVDYPTLFLHTETVYLPSFGHLEAYPNRDATKALLHYNLKDLKTCFKGSLRKKGFSEMWFVLAKLGLTSNIKLPLFQPYSFKSLITRLNPEVFSKEDFLRLIKTYTQKEEVLDMLFALDLWSDEEFPNHLTTTASALQWHLEHLWALKPNEQDVVILHQEINYTIGDLTFLATADFVKTGEDQRLTAMTQCVGVMIGTALDLIIANSNRIIGILSPSNLSIAKQLTPKLKEEGFEYTLSLQD
jgi:saccharopine dehydrogenase-like NADP-dependent oxidoreductase